MTAEPSRPSPALPPPSAWVVGPIADPLSLAIARIVVFSVIAWRFSLESMVAYAQLPPELVEMPIGTGWAQVLMPADPGHVRTLGWVVRLSAAAAALGCLTRVATWMATLSAGVLFALPTLYGHVGHSRHHLIWFGAVLAVSRCGDRLSVDRLIARWRFGPQPVPRPSARYGFPFTAMLLTMGVAYFFAGAWKAAAGPEWFTSGNLAHLAAKLQYAGFGGHGALLWIHPWAPVAGAFGVVAFELSFVFLVWIRRTRFLALALAFFFHTAMFVVLGISFGTVLYCYLAFFDWPLLWRGLRPAAMSTLALPEAARPSVALRAVAAVLVGGNLVFGALGLDGWPLSAYPRFDTVHTPFVTSYAIEGRQADGRLVRLHDGELGRPHLTAHFYNVFRGRLPRHAGLEDPVDDGQRRWERLCTFVWGRHPVLAGARDVRFLLEDLDLSGGAEAPRRVAARPIFTCESPRR